MGDSRRAPVAGTGTTRHFVALDGLRGVAAVLVVVWHVCEYFQLGFAPGHAYLAVDFFFMLSGFVISHAYDARLANGLGVLRFTMIRLVRLYPMIAIGIAMGTVTWVLRAHVIGDAAIPSILLAALFNAVLIPTSALLAVRPFAFPIDGPLWSLSAEMTVNVVYATCYRFLTSRRLLSVAVIGAAGLSYVALSHGSLNNGFYWHDFGLSLVRVVYPFCVGILLRRHMAGRFRKSSAANAAAVLLTALLVAPIGGGSGLYDLLVVLAAFPLVIVAGAQARAVTGLDTVWRSLGRLSYPLYVTHYPIVAATSNLARHAGLVGWRNIAASVLCLVATIVFAVLLGTLEKRMSRRLRPLVQRSPRPA